MGKFMWLQGVAFLYGTSVAFVWHRVRRCEPLRVLFRRILNTKRGVDKEY